MGLHLLHFFLMSIGAPKKKKLDDLLVQLKKMQANNMSLHLLHILR